MLEVHNHPARFKVIVAHRRFGKSVKLFNHVQREALSKPGRYGIVGPTYKQVKSIYWRGGIVRTYLPDIGKVVQMATNEKFDLLKKRFGINKNPLYKANNTEVFIEYANGSILEFIGSDDYDSHRGTQFDYLGMDEYSEQKPEAWDSVFRYTILEQAQTEIYLNESEEEYMERERKRFKGGGAMFTGTLKGQNHLWAMYLRGLAEIGNWKSWMFKASETGLLSQTDIDEIRIEVKGNEAILRQELECEPMYFSGLIYPEFSDLNIVEPFTIPRQWSDLPFPGALDHGGTNPTAVGKYAVDPEGNIFMTKEYYKANEIISNHAEEIRKTFDVPESEYLSVIADPSTLNKTMEQNEKRISVADRYLEYKIILHPAMEERGVIAGIDSVKELLRFDPKHIHPLTGKMGSPRLFFFKDCCPATEGEFGKYIWEEPPSPEMNAPQKPKKSNDHSMDQLRYFCTSKQAPTVEAEQKPFTSEERLQADIEQTIVEATTLDGEEWV